MIISAKSLSLNSVHDSGKDILKLLDGLGDFLTIFSRFDAFLDESLHVGPGPSHLRPVLLHKLLRVLLILGAVESHGHLIEFVEHREHPLIAEHFHLCFNDLDKLRVLFGVFLLVGRIIFLFINTFLELLDPFLVLVVSDRHNDLLFIPKALDILAEVLLNRLDLAHRVVLKTFVLLDKLLEHSLQSLNKVLVLGLAVESPRPDEVLHVVGKHLLDVPGFLLEFDPAFFAEKV